MILRRVIAHVRKQEWTAIGIDFLIVVVGVFVGIQVANWNASRIERALEATYLSSLAEDIRSDIEEIDEINRVSTQRMSALNHLLWGATGKELPAGFDSARGRIEIENVPPYDERDPNSIGIAMFILTTLDGNRLTYDTLINNAGISVIRDQSLIRAIQSYYAAVDQVLDFEVALEVSRGTLVDAQQQSGLSPVDATPAAELAKTFGEDTRLLAAAKNYWLYTNRHLRLMRSLRHDAKKLAAIIESERQP